MQKKLKTLLRKWHKTIDRDLPWKDFDDAYTIWLSEILLQQTRVEQAKPYFFAFKKAFPTVKHLAKAKEEKVMKLWQGLGYYSRARNLHFTAKFIVDELNGEFPNTFDDLIKLKGVGNYTAAAVASFAFGLPNAVLDGNVYRVLSRIFAYEKAIDSTESVKHFRELSQLCLDKKEPAKYNQAIMDFGALYCVPKNPDCKNCVMKKSCGAFQNNLVQIIPFKAKKIKKKTRYFNYLFFNIDDEKVILSQRTGKDIWQNLFEFPLFESEKEAELVDIQKFINDNFENLKNDFEIEKTSKVYKHILTHQTLFVKFIFINLRKKVFLNNLYIVVNFDGLKDFAVPKVIEKFLLDFN